MIIVNPCGCWVFCGPIEQLIKFITIGINTPHNKSLAPQIPHIVQTCIGYSLGH